MDALPDDGGGARGGGGCALLRACGRFGLTDDLVWLIRSAYVFGPTPVGEAMAQVRALAATAGDSPLLQAGASSAIARLLAMEGDIDQARALQVAAREIYVAAGMTVTAASVSLHASWIERRAGDVRAWEEALRQGIETLDDLDERAYNSTLGIDLGECLYAQDRLDEVWELCARTRAMSPPEDFVNFVYADALEGCVLARRGLHRRGACEARARPGARRDDGLRLHPRGRSLLHGGCARSPGKPGRGCRRGS